MKLDTLEQRRKLICDLQNMTLKFGESVEYLEDDNDWAGSTVIYDDLTALFPMIGTEEIFCDLLDEMRSHDCKSRDIFANIVSNRRDLFIEDVLLSRLNHAVNNLHRWGFRSEAGKKYYRSTHKKLDALVEKYQNLYDL